MTRSNKRKKQDAGKGQQLRAGLFFMAMLLTIMAAGCFGKPSKQTGAPTGEATPEPTKEAELTPKPTPTPKLTVTPSGTAFTPSGTGGSVTFTGNTVEISKAQIGDTVRFGSYEQDNDTSNGEEAIEWFVLDEQDGKLLLLSKDALDCKKYNEENTSVTWETCTLRGWLNGTFYNTAFSQTEQGRIATTKVRNEDNPGCDRLGAAVVDYGGDVYRSGDGVYSLGAVVRPAFWLNLES